MEGYFGDGVHYESIDMPEELDVTPQKFEKLAMDMRGQMFDNDQSSELRYLMKATCRPQDSEPAPAPPSVPTGDLKGSTCSPSEALIRAREAVIAAGYVAGLDAELQIRAGQHDDWQVLQIAYHALLTSGVDLDVLRKYHAPGQLALIKPQDRPVVVVRERRSMWNQVCTLAAKWLRYYVHNQGKKYRLLIAESRATIRQFETTHIPISDMQQRLNDQKKSLRDRVEKLQRNHSITIDEYRKRIDRSMVARIKKTEQDRYQSNDHLPY